MPAALATIAVTLIVSKLLFNEIRFSEVQSDAFWSTFWLENFHLISQSADYFAPGLDKSPLQHFWSLAVEEQFYLFWPVTLLALAKAKFLRRFPFCGHWQSRVLTGTVIFGIPSLIWSYTYTNSNPAGAYFSTFTRAWDLLLGASIALIPFFRAGLSPTLSKAASWLGFAFLTIAVVVINTSTPYPGLIALIPTLGTCLLLVAGVNTEAKNPVYHLLASKPIRWTGKVSYSLYLWHWPLIIFAAAIVPKSDFGGLPRGVLLFALSLLLAWISYELIEAPFMNFKKFKAQNYDRIKKAWTGNQQASLKAAAMATGAAVALLTIAAFARPGDAGVFEPPKALQAYSNGSAVANLVAKVGQPQDAGGATGVQTDANLPAKEKLALETWKGAVLSAAQRDSASASEIKLAEQGTKLAPNPDCYVIMTMDRANACALQGLGTQHVTWPEGVPKTVALLGHSVAAQFRETIASVLPKDVKIVPLTITSCQLTAAPADDIANRQGVDCGKHNEWAIAQAKKLNPGLVAFSVVLGSKPEDAATQALGKKLEGLPGKKLFIVNAPQTAPFSECINGTNIHACKQTTDTNVLTNIGNAKAFSSKFGLSEFSLADLICKSGQCPPFIKGYPVRFDGQHLTSGMMDRIAPFLASSIQLALKNYSR